MKYLCVIERGSDGSFSAYVPDLPGCVTSGDSEVEVRQLIGEAVQLHIESLKAHGEAVPPATSIADVIEAA